MLAIGIRDIFFRKDAVKIAIIAITPDGFAVKQITVIDF
jgi:hypothetical protein